MELIDHASAVSTLFKITKNPLGSNLSLEIQQLSIAEEQVHKITIISEFLIFFSFVL